MSARLARDLLIAVASFLLVGAGVVRVLVPPVLLAQWPLAGTSSRAVATSAVVLDPVTLELQEDVTLVQSRVVTPVATGVEAAAGYVVSTSTRREGGGVVLRQRWTGVQSDGTGAAVPSPLNSELRTRTTSSGDAVEEEVALRTMSGALLRLPPSGDLDGAARWDPQTRTAGPLEQAGRERVEGADTVVLRQRTTSTDGASSVRADTVLWVRPTVGAVVRTTTDLLVRDGGGDVLLDARFVDDDASVAAASAAVDAREDQLDAWRSTVPVALLAAGLGALVGAVVVTRRAGRNPPAEPAVT